VKDEILAELRDKMEDALEALERDFKRVRTGRATVSLLDGVRAEAYGSLMPLNQLATLSAPEPRLLLIQPWDASILPQIEKGILKSELGLTPMSDGKVIRISIPPLTEERRKELVKLVRKMSEEGRVSVRNARRDANDMFKDLKKEGDMSEDEAFKAQEEVQEITDEYIKKVDEILKAKEQEVMEV
jgi:ribosome recycling factor